MSQDCASCSAEVFSSSLRAASLSWATKQCRGAMVPSKATAGFFFFFGSFKCLVGICLVGGNKLAMTKASNNLCHCLLLHYTHTIQVLGIFTSLK